MLDDKLTNEELLSALSDYLSSRERKKDFLIKEINNNYILDKKIDDINILNNEIDNLKYYYDYKIKDNKLDGQPDRNDIQRQISLQPNSDSFQMDGSAITSFLQDDTKVLDKNSNMLLRRNPRIILASISRDINSINYALSITDEIKEKAIKEAIRQGYVINSYTPSFMLKSVDVIKSSVEKDINSLIYVPYNYITKELEEFAIKLALDNKYILTKDSPIFLKTNIDIIKQSLKLDIQSEKNVYWNSLQLNEIAEIERYIIDNHLKYVVTSNSPVSFKRNIDICITSSQTNIDSVNYFDWDYLQKNSTDIERLYSILLENNYVLNINSPYILRNNTKICLNSVKNDLQSARYFSEDLQYWLTMNLEKYPIETEDDINIKNRIYEIRYFLLENNYYSLEDFSNFSCTLLNDEFVLDYYLSKMGLSKKSKDENYQIFYNRLKDFIKNTMSTSLKVSDARKVFQMVAQKKWEAYRKENNDYYTNIFNRICDSLEKNNNFISAINELKFLIKVDDVLDERKYALFNAFIEYHQIYHNSQVKNKTELLQEKRDEISQNAALFISKSKEDFISEEMSKFDEQFKKYFIIRIDNPIVKKKVVEIKQRDMLKKQFNNKDKSLLQKLRNIKDTYLTYNYSKSINKDNISQILNLFISKIINNNVSSIDDVLSSSKPIRFDEYETFEKVSKLINRLNSHNISFDGKEVDKYRDYIVFDGEKYTYKGNDFNDVELSQIMGYKDLKYVFGKIRSEIIKIAKTIDNFDKVTQEDIKAVIGDCPFTDEFYQFDSSLFDRCCIWYYDIFVEILNDKKEILLDDTKYEIIQKIMNENGLFQLSMLTLIGYSDNLENKNVSSIFNDIKKYIIHMELCEIIENIPSLMALLNPEDITLDNLDKILDFKEMFKYADLKQITLLGKDVIKKIYSNNGFTSSSQAERINVACDLASMMISRKESTVPYISGKYGNYKYSMYDSTDETLLTTGLDTNACFRCCGNDNDFLHYCALDKNGFVIKLTDSEGNFIGRASGFRNGNGVYINQLRTIYDKKSSAYTSEKDAIIKAFKHACNDIVETSQNNPNEEIKIDFVVVTKSYTLSDTASNIDDMTTNKIGNHPMDNSSEDWKQFVTTTKNLRESATLNYFTTDFPNYSLICIKSAVGELTPEKIKKGDVPALYSRKRKKVSVYNPDETQENQINKIKAYYSYQTRTRFNYMKISPDSKVVMGDNWYIVFNNQEILDSCYLSNDQFAEIEFNTVMEQLLKNQKVVEEISIPKKIR